MYKLLPTIGYCSGLLLLGLQVSNFNQPAYSLPETYLEPDFSPEREFQRPTFNPSGIKRESSSLQLGGSEFFNPPNSGENESFAVPQYSVSPANVFSPTENQTENRIVEAKIQSIARDITVKVLAGRVWGSGVLIKKQGNLYTVITNDHVLEAGNRQNYQIQTSDGQIHFATVGNIPGSNGDDLGELQFQSSRNYQIALTRNTTNLNIGESVFASGFPLETNSPNSQDFTITTGHITLLMDRALLGGYQLGYTNNVYQGMSGGPLLDSQGQLIGINGRSKYPLWGNPYVFKDGSFPTGVTRSQLRSSSWAIPIQTVMRLTGITTNPAPTEFNIPRLSLPSQPSLFEPHQTRSW
ncbi:MULTISPECIES: serine protease [Spirulina sp. CCY15215]|uniref:S1 family peptidase n=1 Tax=Spirulina sp. CCY15215 TaxID=2767591 RepID=UPI00194DD4B4|nr:serine protease [Spirulina major]